MIQLIAESGATNTSWRLIGDGAIKSLATKGLNPMQLAPGEIHDILAAELVPFAGATVEKIWFYGAGAVGEGCKTLEEALAKAFPSAQISVESDLLAACRALFGDKPGIACIIGTGSNCCFWDGSAITAATRAGGYILGDEGSGANMGRMLLGDYVKGLIPAALEKELTKRYGLSYETIVQKVYRESAPARYLASFSPFIAEHRNHPYIKALIEESLQAFISRNVARYDARRHRVGFVGSVAVVYEDILSQIFRNAGFKLGPLMPSAIDALAQYHKNLG